MTIRFRLSSNPDPEERLEEAALWKAMHDEYGDEISPLEEADKSPSEFWTFGRQLRNDYSKRAVSDYLPYWEDPAFLKRCNRVFELCNVNDVASRVSRIHAQGKGAFLKSTRSKHFIAKVPVGVDPMEEIGAMVFSFIDGGPELMVQELCEVRFEYRFFVIDRRVICGSPTQWALTPLDFPLPHGTVYETPQSTERIIDPILVSDLQCVAEDIASDMRCPHASVDCALINDAPGVVEFNPMRLGQLGLYAADVRSLARASRMLLPHPDKDM